MIQFYNQEEVQSRVEPFRALMLCFTSSMKMRQVKMHFLQPLTLSDAPQEWITLFVQSLDCSDRKCPQERLLFSFFQSLSSVHWFTLSRSLPDTHEGLHARCPLSSDRDSVCQSISANLDPNPLQPWALPGPQLACLSTGEFPVITPEPWPAKRDGHCTDHRDRWIQTYGLPQEHL